MKEDASNPPELLLASRSARRQQILTEAGFAFRVDSKETEEDGGGHRDPEAIALHIARGKAQASSALRKPGEILLSSDTVVALDGKWYGKAADEQEALAMLQELSGRTHRVCTAVVLLGERGGELEEQSFCESTEVELAPIRPEDMEFYVRKYQPLDKAGAYAIQEWLGLTYIRSIRGCYYNVVGLPMPRLYPILLEWGLKPIR